MDWFISELSHKQRREMPRAVLVVLFDCGDGGGMTGRPSPAVQETSAVVKGSSRGK